VLSNCGIPKPIFNIAKKPLPDFWRGVSPRQFRKGSLLSFPREMHAKPEKVEIFPFVGKIFASNPERNPDLSPISRCSLAHNGCRFFIE
jgi:hypothetical protein